jgi:hypothetical protein
MQPGTASGILGSVLGSPASRPLHQASPSYACMILCSSQRMRQHGCTHQAGRDSHFPVQIKRAAIAGSEMGDGKYGTKDDAFR